MPGPGLPNTSAGLDLASTTTEQALLAGAGFDTLVVVGGEGARRRAHDAAVKRLVQHLAPRARRVVGVCTGTFILAAAGLLQGCRVTTHWRWCAELACRHPGLKVEPEPIYLRDGNIWTSAGISAGMDLALALVEEDHGHTLALAVARELVLFLRRPSDQKQFSTVLSAQTGPTARLGGLLAWIAENLHRPLAVTWRLPRPVPAGRRRPPQPCPGDSPMIDPSKHLQIGSLLFEGLDQIDLTGPFEVLARIPNSTHRIYAKSTAPVKDIVGLRPYCMDLPGGVWDRRGVGDFALASDARLAFQAEPASPPPHSQADAQAHELAGSAAPQLARV